jgi:hypothetical protein
MKNPESPPPNKLDKAITIAGSMAFLYLVTWWSFSPKVKDEIWWRQKGECGDDGCNKVIDEYHHIYPERAFRGSGTRGKDTAENGVGLCYHHHKRKWDRLMFEGIFYPGVKFEELSPDTYVKIQPPKPKKRKRRR